MPESTAGNAGEGPSDSRLGRRRQGMRRGEAVRLRRSGASRGYVKVPPAVRRNTTARVQGFYSPARRWGLARAPHRRKGARRRLRRPASAARLRECGRRVSPSERSELLTGVRVACVEKSRLAGGWNLRPAHRPPNGDSRCRFSHGRSEPVGRSLPRRAFGTRRASTTPGRRSAPSPGSRARAFSARPWWRRCTRCRRSR